ncbi:MAG: TolC family protein [Phycisphaerales bacterium]|nr:TolC family protein [Phycisphaerales bacterium]
MNTPPKAPLRRRMRAPAWSTVPLLLSSCASLDPAADIHQAATLSAARLHTGVAEIWAQPVDSPSIAWDGATSLTAETAIIVALQNEPELRSELARIAEHRADLGQAQVLPNPTIAFGIGMATDGLSGSPAIVQGLQALTWLWTRPDRIAVAEASLQQTILTASSTTIDLAARVSTSHAKVLAAQALVTLDAENLDITEQTFALIQRRNDVGEASKLDLDRSEVDAQNARSNLVAAERELEQAKLALLLDIGWPGHHTDWSAAEPVGITPPQEQDDIWLCELAATQRLDLAAAQAAVEKEVAGLALAGTRKLPEVRFTFGWQRSFMDRKAVMPGASITIPILDNGDPAVAKAAARIEWARMQWLDLANHIEFSVRDAASKWRQAAAQAEITERGVLSAATGALIRSRAAYSEGVVDLTVLLLAQEQHIATQRTLVTQRLSEAVSLVELRRSVGGVFTPLPDAMTQGVVLDGGAS